MVAILLSFQHLAAPALSDQALAEFIFESLGSGLLGGRRARFRFGDCLLISAFTFLVGVVGEDR